MAPLLRAAVLACLLTCAAPAAVAQFSAGESLFPASIGDFTAVEYFSNDSMPIYGNAFFSGLPTLREVAAYLREDGGEALISLIIVNERYPLVAGLDDDEAAIGLVSFHEAPLTPNDGWYEASVETSQDEFSVGRAIVVRPLTGHAILTAESFEPETVSTDDLRAMLESVDLDALDAHVRSHSGTDAGVWDLLAAMPQSLDGHERAGFHIESDGRREPMISINALYGDAEKPEYAVVASGAGPDVTDIEEILPFRLTSELTETTVGEWRVLDGIMDGMSGRIVLGDLAVVALFHLSESSTPEHRREMMSDLDIQGIFESAASYRASARAAAPAASRPEGGEMQLVPWAHVLEAELIKAITAIDDEQIIFAAGHPQLDEFSLMDILLSHHEAQPFLRRIVSIEARGETVVIETRPAGLEEVIAPR